MRVAIFSRVYKLQDREYIQQLYDELYRNEFDVYSHTAYYEQIVGNIRLSDDNQFSSYKDLKTSKIDYLISLGGDGTILDALTLVRDTGVPIMGINLGRLGFLATIDKHSIVAAVRSLKDRAFEVDQRTLLHLDADPPIFGDMSFALNDCTVLRSDSSSMIIIHTYINGEFLNSYWADGLIISTPAGSTGYSLSCGGPIIYPNSGNFIITPVAPHNLNVRPIVIPDDAVISFEVEGRAKEFLCTLDTRQTRIKSSYELAISKEKFTAGIIRLHNRNFLSTLREKLFWGVDTRN
jgi:NAD+ kinase